MNKDNLVEYIKENKILVIVRGVSGDNLEKLFSAIKQGGLNCAEITFGKYSDEETSSMLAEMVKKFGDEMWVGAGTVTTLKRAELALKAGVSFIVSPISQKDVIDYAKANGVKVISGAFTPTEIKNAYDMGADIVKVFPANILGADYIKSVLQPLGEIPLICFGGINQNNICDYLKAGVVGAGVGADIVNMEYISQGEFEKITEKVQNIVKTVKNCLK